MSERTLYVRRALKCEGDQFARIMNSSLQDNRLSLRARGLLALVLSMPPTWEHSAERLAEQCREGADAIRGALRELTTAGYARLSVTRGHGGRIVSRWHFYEVPDDQTSPDAKNPEPVPPDAILPRVGGPTSGKCRAQETTDVETNIEMSPTLGRVGSAVTPDFRMVQRAVQGLGGSYEQAQAFWSMQTQNAWHCRGQPILNWEQALHRWLETDRKRKPTRGGMTKATFMRLVHKGGYSEQTGHDFWSLLEKRGWRLPNPLTDRNEPVSDIWAAFVAFEASDLNQDFERRGAR